jgi:uncharacterized membrane protein YhiD involved in acid resistance
LLESLFQPTTVTTFSITETLLSLAVALIVGFIISLTYMKTHKGAHSSSFALTLILLPGVIAAIILMIGSNVARAFSLLGAFSIIRFRSAPGEPKDIAFVLFSLAAGLAAGAGVLLSAIVITLVLCGVMLLLDTFKYGLKSSEHRVLIITVPEDLDYETALHDILIKYTVTWQLQKVKMTAMGSLYVLTYEVRLKKSVSIKSFIDDLRTRNGNLNINLNVQGEYTKIEKII